MPIYEYKCRGCGGRTAVFTRRLGADPEAACEHCGSHDLSRLISRVAVLRSDSDELSAFDESSLADLDENDPRSVAKWVRKMSRQMGEPLDGEMEAELERMEAGEMPETDGDDSEEEGLAP
jgi:putative FmdB family regulatory protein